MSGIAALIETPRLRLEPFTTRYLTPRYVGWLNDPRITRYTRHAEMQHSLQSCTEYVAGYDGSDNGLWAIVLRDGDRHIGNINAMVEIEHSTADMGIMIGDTALSGQGLATEAWGALRRFLHEKVGIRKVTGGAIAPNKAMLAVMRRSGMKPDGTRRQHQVWCGEPVDVIHMASFADESE